MDLIRHHHHFRKDLIDPGDRVALCERYVIDSLLTTSLPDSQRDSSIAWELKHHAGVTQMARLLARKRGLPIDVCTVGALLHDIYVILHGKYQDHAHKGGPIAVEILSQIGGFSPEELDQAYRVVYHHSDKDIRSSDRLREFGKDADILDIFLYPGPFGEYLLIKSLPLFYHYLDRAIGVWEELGIPKDPRFDLLKNYNSQWFRLLMVSTVDGMQRFLGLLLELSSFPKTDSPCPPAFCIMPGVVGDTRRMLFYTNQDNWDEYVDRIASKPGFASSARLPDRFEDLLKPLLGKEPFQPESLYYDESYDYLVSEEMKAKASRLISQVTPDRVSLLFWPLADLYEVVSIAESSVRLRELGIPEA